MTFTEEIPERIALLCCLIDLIYVQNTYQYTNEEIYTHKNYGLVISYENSLAWKISQTHAYGIQDSYVWDDRAIPCYK